MPTIAQIKYWESLKGPKGDKACLIMVLAKMGVSSKAKKVKKTLQVVKERAL